MKLNNKTQMYLAIGIALVCFVLAYIFGRSSVFMFKLFRMLGISLAGLLYAIHPVVPPEEANNKGLKKAVRLVGIIVVLVGLFT